MSGGVDSSVAALLLKQEGYDLIGVHMICWEGCENNQDKQDAMRVCAELEIPFLVWDFRREYKKEVFNDMNKAYKAGRTPNPDVMCNKKIKFGIFLKRALGAGADFIATGHYVRLAQNILSSTHSSPQRGSSLSPHLARSEETSDHHARSVAEGFAQEHFELHVAKDPSKDQSYFLWTLTQEQLKYCLFPIGDYLKSEVRELAQKFNLPTSEKKDSQGLCFVGNINFGKFLRSKVDTKSGNIIKKDRTVIGKHDGVQFYTIGQRHGLNIGGFSQPLYVTEKDIQTNTITVSEGEDDPMLFQLELNTENIHWIFSPRQELGEPLKCLARIRYRQPLQKCSVFKDGRVVFYTPQRAVASGQSIVFYDNDIMLGGGIIA